MAVEWLRCVAFACERRFCRCYRCFCRRCCCCWLAGWLASWLLLLLLLLFEIGWWCCRHRRRRHRRRRHRHSRLLLFASDTLSIPWRRGRREGRDCLAKCHRFQGNLYLSRPRSVFHLLLSFPSPSSVISTSAPRPPRRHTASTLEFYLLFCIYVLLSLSLSFVCRGPVSHLLPPHPISSFRV